MPTKVRKKIARLLKDEKRRNQYLAALALLAVTVAMSVASVLTQEGHASITTQQVLDCRFDGIAAHTHDDSCYDEYGNLVCPLPEREIHIHDDSCYLEERVLTCELEEGEGHTHDDSCYETERTLVCGQDEVAETHVHGSGCFTTVEVEVPDAVPTEDQGLVAGSPLSQETGDAALAATHPAQAFKHEFRDADQHLILRVDVEAPVGALPKGTTMVATWVDPATMSQKQQDAVDGAIAAKVDGQVLGMQAVDIEFRDATGAKVEPAANVTVTMTSGLINTDDKALIVHIDDLTDDQLRQQEFALMDGKTAEEAEPQRTAEAFEALSDRELARRDVELSENQLSFESGRFSTYVLAVTSLHKVMQASDGATVTVTVDAPAGAGIPQDAELQVREVAQGSSDWQGYESDALAAIGAEEVELARFFDITILAADGSEIQPAEPVQVEIELADAPSGAEASVVHFGKTAELVPASEDDGVTTFDADSFSVWGVVYTVDFHWVVDGQDYAWSIQGGGATCLRELLPALGIVSEDEFDGFVSHVADVTFSDPELVAVARMDETMTVSELVKSLGLQPTYSAELTSEQIVEMEARQLAAPDWALLSLAAFDTDETLTITMTNGEKVAIHVTDEQITTNVLTADGKTYEITVTFDDDAEIPRGTKLVAKEIKEDSDEYVQHLCQAWEEVNKDYLEQEEKALQHNNNGGLDDREGEDIRPVNLDDARFFDIKLMHGDDEVEPKAPVQVDIRYVDGLETSAAKDEAIVGVAHYTKDGVELIDDVETKRNKKGKLVEFSYEQDSFSGVGTYVGQKTFDNVPYQMSPLAMSRLVPTGSGTLKDIEAHKSLTNNNDGTYTLSLTVKGDSYSEIIYDKKNVLFVMDRSSSMKNEDNDIYTLYTGEYQDNTTYYGVNGFGQHVILSHRNGKYYMNSWQYNGDVYTRQSRLAAEQAAMDVLIQDLLGKNDPNTPGKSDIIEISVISFADERQTGKNTEYTGWASDAVQGYTDLMTAINQTHCPSGTNWEDALMYAKEIADQKKADQPNEDLYVIFLTDGEPTAVAGESGGAYHYNSERGGFEFALTEDRQATGWHGTPPDSDDGKNSLGRAKEIVDAGYKFYGIFTFNPGEAQTKYLRRLMNFAYTGVDKAYENEATTEDTEIVKKYFTNADTPENLAAAFENIFADIMSTTGHGQVVLEDGLQSADAMTTTIHAGNAGGYRYSVTDKNGTELYYVTATGSDTNPTVTFHIDGVDYDAGVSKVGMDNKPYYSVSVGGAEYKMALADLKGRELTWDLSAIGILLPECTYKMDLIVWPNQAAYDYVAGLNNHLEGYTWDSSVESNPDNYYEVTVGGQTYGYYTGGVAAHPSIVRYANQDVYSVLTNTHQKLNYSIVNTQTNELTGDTTITTDPQDPVPLEDQKPMDLVDTDYAIEKQWNIDMNPSILAQLLYPASGEHYTLGFDIFQGTNTTPYTTVNLGWDSTLNEYVWEADSVRDIEYNKQTYQIGTTWKKDFAISTGLMLSEERMDALEMDKSAYPSGTYSYEEDGETITKTYYLLENGHDYTIKERGLSYEFDFEADVFHPMLVDGKMQNVIFTQSGNSISISDMTTTTTGLSSLKVENTLRGYIHLEKVVVDEDGQRMESNRTKFKYTVVLNNADAPFDGTHIPWYAINDLFYHDADFNYYQVSHNGENFTLKDEAGNVYEVVGTYDVDDASEQTITYLVDGEQTTLQLWGNQSTSSNGNKTATAELWISQTERLSIANVPAGTTYTITEGNKTGYELIGIDYSIDPDDLEVDEPSIDLGNQKIEGTIVPNHHNYAVFTNKYHLADITIQKVDESGDGLEGAVFRLVSVGDDGEAPLTEVDGLGTVTKVVDGETKTYESAFETTGGVQTLAGLPDGTYRLYEVYVPAGYVCQLDRIEFTITDRVMQMVTEDESLEFDPASGNNLALLTITNEPGVPLPNSGGMGTAVFYLFGGMVMAIAGLSLALRARRQVA